MSARRLLIVLSTVVAACAALAAPKTVPVKIGADSEANGYEAYRAMDGNPATMWHTHFGAGETDPPHDLVLDLGKPFVVTGISCLQRTDGCPNGVIKEYELCVGDDPKKFGDPVAKGSFAKADGENIVTLAEPVTGRYLRLRALSEVNGRAWSSIAELKIASAPGLVFRASDSSGMVLPGWIGSPQTEIERQYTVLVHDLRNRRRFAGFASQAFREEALIDDSDRDPVDVVLRRTQALLADIQGMANAPDLSAMATELAALQGTVADTAVEDGEARVALFKKLCELRRRVAFSNPLLSFDKLLFIKHHRAVYNHMCDQYYGITARPGGGVFVLSDPFGEEPQVRDLLAESVVERGRLKGTKLRGGKAGKVSYNGVGTLSEEKIEPGGAFVSPDLSYDGKTVLFAYVECDGDNTHRFHTDATKGHWHEGRCFHVFKVNVDGTGLEQLTDGTFNDFDPCWFPNGRVVFISERRGGYLRCGRVCPTYTLCDMAADGSDIRCLSPHETNEWHPSVTHDGMIIYTRWDYVDRHGCTAHLPWITTPDGRDSRAVHGNFAPRPTRPDMELDIRAIPGSRKFVGTAAPHHGQSFGSLVVIDPKIEDDDAMAPVKRLTPDVAFPESQGGKEVYGTAWPLSEDYYLCCYDPAMAVRGLGRAGVYGLYLVDSFGNKELLYRDPEIACQNPIPLKPRPTPPLVPEMSKRVPEDELAEGTLGVINVYESLKPWPEGTTIKALRVYQILPMSMPSGRHPHEVGLRLPSGRDSVILARYVLGTVPVEADGSAYFTAPARRELFFQALDERGLAVQSMRSATYLQPGEQLMCQGCHEPKHDTPRAPKFLPLAMRRAPSRIEPDVDGSNPFSYPLLVQPVLDKHCVGCHQKNKDKAPRLDSEIAGGGRNRWYASYQSLAPKYGFWNYGDSYRTTPGSFGARASKLFTMLDKGHHDLKLPPEDLHRIALWLDSCSVFYGVYEKEGGEAQLAGKVVRPTLE